MGELRFPHPVLLVIAVFSRHSEAFDWSRRQLSERFGNISLYSPLFVFDQTEYYARDMGPGLQKQFFGNKLVNHGIFIRSIANIEHNSLRFHQLINANQFLTHFGRCQFIHFSEIRVSDFFKNGYFLHITIMLFFKCHDLFQKLIF